uniref:Uncharacterized protein n=1 Tax=Elaeophora elaphi TaxID=1147741 RepID=A0A0R3RJQ6_9BILA
QSHCTEERSGYCSGSIKIPLQSIISTQKRTSRTSLGGQWRKLLFASGAALCALLFAILAAQTMRKAKQSFPEVIIPNLSARRSTIARISRKSVCESNLNQEENGTTRSQQILNSVPKDDTTAKIERTPSLTPDV